MWYIANIKLTEKKLQSHFKMNFTKDFIYQRLKNDNRPVVIYGTGNGAEKLIYHLNSYGISVDGIFASDDFARERTFCGFKVQKFSDIMAEFSEPIILLGFATDRKELLLKIKEISKKVHGSLYVPEVPVFGNDIFTPEVLKMRKGDIEKLYSLLADEQSRKIMESLINFKISADPQYLYDIETSREELYTNIIRPQSGDVFIDAGAYNGDTAEEFITFCPDFGGIYAIEPAPVNFRKLRENPKLQNKPNIKLLNFAVSSKSTTASFSEKGGRSPFICDNGKITVEVKALDEMLCEAPDIVKLDVEGFEEEALLGAFDTIKRYKPKLMVSAYHKTEDFIDIPLLIHKLNPDYKLYLRHHPYLPAWETNVYAV